MSASPFKLTKEEIALEKKCAGKTLAEQAAIKADFYAKKAAKALRAKQKAKSKRLWKNLKEGRPILPTARKTKPFATGSGSDYDRIKTFNGIVRHGGFG